MNNTKFTLWNRITALMVFLIAAVTYLLTIEPTASFWDCGEFIASSYKLEVGHPPGNPVFQLFARFATMFAGPEHAAMAINAMNAILSALTIMLLYLTTVFLVKRLVKPEADGNYSLSRAIVIFGSGAVGALAYTFTDTFWFSAVEAEVYAMSSFFTALVFWAMTKWYEQADEPYANRWLVLIAFLMGLSIGIHLLNLLTIPALVFMFFYKKRENLPYTFLQLLGIFAVSVAILAFVLYGVIPYLPRLAAKFDMFFVNTLGLPFNSGAAFFMILLLGLCFWGLYKSMQAKQVLLNTVLLCFTVIVIGFSLFSIVIIRSSARTPTNEYQPDNPFTLVRYLDREQYGKNPLIYGQAFDSPFEFEDVKYWARVEGEDEYYEADGPGEVEYYSEGKMLFPRMWSSDDRHQGYYYEFIDGWDEHDFELFKNVKEVFRLYPDLYEYQATLLSYFDENDQERLRKILSDERVNKIFNDRDELVLFITPSQGDNLDYFFDYQMNWMYWRYFMWNFAGRQNDIHGDSPNQFKGNWECGIDFIDHARLGDQSDAPGYMGEGNKGKNHYYMLPLLLGLIGIFFQCVRDGRGSWVTFLMFFMTGIAVVVYLNQPPYQPRERDYAYAGSFYTFCIWIGIAVAALYTWINELLEVERRGKKCAVITASVVTALALGVPTLMAVENWDDHDRSNRYTAVEMAKNYLNSVGENGILITHGDNDTFPLWYAQEVEGVRTDVRIANTSLLGTDWHIQQMKWATNDSAPLDLTLGPMKYLYGTNEYMYIDPYQENDGQVLDLKAMINSLNKGDYKLEMQDGTVMEYIPARKYTIPVNKENILKNGILDRKYADQIPDEIVLTLPKSKQHITKPELFMLDLLSNYKWDRPINLLSMGGDINVGIKEYLMYEGFSYKFVPIKNKMSRSDIGFSDPEDLYYKMKNVFTWDALKRTDYFVDYHNLYTFCGVLSQRQIFVNVAKELIEVGEYEKAIEILDMCQEYVLEANFPLVLIGMDINEADQVLKMAAYYHGLGEEEKAESLMKRFKDELNSTYDFFGPYINEDDNKSLVYRYICTKCEYKEYFEEVVRKSIEGVEISSDETFVVDNWGLPEYWLELIELYYELGKGEYIKPIVDQYCGAVIRELETLLFYSFKALENDDIEDYRNYLKSIKDWLSDIDKLRVMAEDMAWEDLVEFITDWYKDYTIYCIQDIIQPFEETYENYASYKRIYDYNLYEQTDLTEEEIQNSILSIAEDLAAHQKRLLELSKLLKIIGVQDQELVGYLDYWGNFKFE